MEIKSGSAVLEREQEHRAVRGRGDGHAGRGHPQVGTALVSFSDEEHLVQRVEAEEDVVMTSAGGRSRARRAFPGGSGPAGAAGKEGRDHRPPDRTLEQVFAGPDGELTVRPRRPTAEEAEAAGQSSSPSASTPQGRVEEVQAQKDAVFEGTPLPPSKSPPRKVTSQSFVAKMDPAKGEPREIEFVKDVGFTDGLRRASASGAGSNGAKSLLILKEDPKMVDEEEGSELQARPSTSAPRAATFAGAHSVRHVPSQAGRGLWGPRSSRHHDQPFFDYAADIRTRKYREEALLRSGKDEIARARSASSEAGEGKRRLEAEGGCGLPPPSQGGGRDGKPAAAVEGRAKEMVYDEAKRTVVYKGDVVIRQGDIQTKSPRPR
jgi:hypothetical protein